MQAIVYKSNTGHTRRYAQMLAKRTGLKALTLDEALKTLPPGAEVVYLGWLFASKIRGLAKAQKRFQVRAVCGVGSGFAGEEMIRALRAANKLDGAALFYCQGGMDKSRLNPLYRALLSAMAKNLEKESPRTEQQDAMLDMLKNGADLVSEAALEPLAAALMQEMEEKK